MQADQNRASSEFGGFGGNDNELSRFPLPERRAHVMAREGDAAIPHEPERQVRKPAFAKPPEIGQQHVRRIAARATVVDRVGIDLMQQVGFSVDLDARQVDDEGVLEQHRPVIAEILVVSYLPVDQLYCVTVPIGEIGKSERRRETAAERVLRLGEMEAMRQVEQLTQFLRGWHAAFFPYDYRQGMSLATFTPDSSVTICNRQIVTSFSSLAIDLECEML